MADPIKVLIVEDSPTVSRILSSIIESDPALQVVGIASDGAEAVRLTSRLRPHIITMDVNMPRMSGLEATQYIMAHQPTPILVLTAFSKQDVNLSFKMLSAGALELIEKPEADELKLSRNHILDRIKLLSRIKVITHVRGKYLEYKELQTGPTTPVNPTASGAVQVVSPAPEPVRVAKPPTVKTTFPPSLITKVEKAEKVDKLAGPETPVPQIDLGLRNRRFEVMGIAASTGGPPALARVLRELPATMPVPVFVVQHIPAGFSTGLADWLNGETPLEVRLTKEGEMPRPGVVYLPADDTHLAFWPDGRCRLDNSPARYGLRPSADITFESMSKTWPGKTLALMLTGMGRDGSVGMRQMKEAGGYNIAQDEASSVIFGMPKAAIELEVVDQILALGHMADYIKQIFRLKAPFV